MAGVGNSFYLPGMIMAGARSKNKEELFPLPCIMEGG
jgi:hypothetical protein